jgi:hypothetical protein
MSPDEFELRAALRDGEGQHLDVDRVVARAQAAQAARRERRVRFASVAAVIAVVSGIGVGGGIALSNGNHDNSKDSSSSLSEKDSAGGGQAIASAPNFALQPEKDCPPTLPQPTSGSTTASPPASAKTLFSGPVSAVLICAYPESSGPLITRGDGTPLTTVLTGDQATALVASLDGASKQLQTQPCPLYRTADGKTLLIIGVSPAGVRMAPVTASASQNPCNQPVTNGAAVRYNWSPPSFLDAYIAQLQGPAPSPSGTMHGSPIHS